MISSHELFRRAKQFIPGGVNSPVRSFNAVGGDPVFFSHGSKAYLFDVEGKAYIDYVGSWGALILGHAPDRVVTAVEQAVKRGLSFGAPTSAEIDLAEKISILMPNLSKVRLMNSGTEATMTAIRLARGFTGRLLSWPCRCAISKSRFWLSELRDTRLCRGSQRGCSTNLEC